MIDLLMVIALTMQQSARSDTDTSFAVIQGTRLKLHNQGGDIRVKAWDRDQVRIQADHSSRTEVGVEVRGSVLELSARGRRGLSSMIDYTITVPAWMAVDLGGMYADVSVEGTQAAIKVETLEGDIDVRGGADVVSLRTVNGRIDLVGANGRIDLNAISDDIAVADVKGDLVVESVSGDIDLRRVDARSVDAQTVSGDVVFEGRLTGTGNYSLLTHSGDVTVAVPEGTNASISVSSAGGDVSTSMNLQAERTSRRRQTYRLGTGGATIEIETFNGDVDLLRPSELAARRTESERMKKSIKAKHKPERDSDEHEEDDDHERGEGINP